MPPKGKDKKGAPVGNYKTGKQMKDILPPGSKPPREGQQIKMEGEPNAQRNYSYQPFSNPPEWTSNENAKNHDFQNDCQKHEDGTIDKFVDNSDIYLPPSFHEYEKNEILWLRPEEYLREIAYEQEVSKRKQEKKNLLKKKQTMRKQSILALGTMTNLDMINEYGSNTHLAEDKIHGLTVKEELKFDTMCIQFEERYETEEEVKKRKEEAEKQAALEKQAKKKPSKGAQLQDPMDEPQQIKVPVENQMDMGFLMPLYSKWVTSQLQFIKDRSIRDIDSKESIWQRIYPQVNGLPVISESGKYWVKLRFMGKERIVEIDDRMPCDSKKKLMLPRTINNFEIWPQLIMKALLKLYSYKWYHQNAYYDNEVGDGCIVYSLSGLIPEPITIKDFEKEGIDILRRLLSDEHYFGKKSYVTCYCDNDYRPKLPTQLSSLKKLDNSKASQYPSSNPSLIEESIEHASQMSPTSSAKMLGRLRHAATMAISVATGKKISLRTSNNSNVITGFGYALMDYFENQFVDMDSITKQKDQIDEVKSPFLSPARKRKERGISKEEWKKKRREEKKKEQEERERREREPSKQYQLIKIKTSAGRYPAINYVSPFTNDEITEAKNCLLNRIRRPQSQIQVESPMTYRKQISTAGEANVFHLNVQKLDASQEQNKKQNDQEDKDQQQTEEKEFLVSKTRAPGGIWLQANDFPNCFQHLIVYHNVNKFTHLEKYSDLWLDSNQPYIANQKDVVIKLELEQEVIDKLKQEQNILQGHLDQSKISENNLNQESKGEINKEDSKLEEQSNKQSQAPKLLPGEIIHQQATIDQVLIGYAPYPTNQPSQVLPRYLMRINQINESNQEEVNEQTNIIDFSMKSYFESKFEFLTEANHEKGILWLKPTLVAPQGFHLWIASQVRKISIVPFSEYLTQSQQFFKKEYTVDYLPQEKGKYHMFTKYDFKGLQEDTKINLRIDCPNDKYLLRNMRLVLIDKSTRHQIEQQITMNQMKLDNFMILANDNGYILMIEGFMPYNTTEGQLQLELLTNKESLELSEIQHVEPLEYSDAYKPSKYGIIFKEKIVIGAEHTMTAINIKLKKNNIEFDQIEGMNKLFKLQVLDNGKVIFAKEGFNQITIPHFIFRSNNGLPESSENQEDEVKHAYVIQTVFDLHEWSNCKTNNEETENITWHMKMYSSETLALIKDTDKEDREKALKQSWETNEQGRAEKAKKSRLKYLLQQRLKNGEQLSEEEMQLVNEIRERTKKRDEQEPVAKGAKGKAPPSKGNEKGKGKPVQQEAQVEKQERQIPQPQDHVNNQIRDFLQHYQSQRLIHISCDKTLARQRSEQEKQSLAQQKEKEIEESNKLLSEIQLQRDQIKEEQLRIREDFQKKFESDRSEQDQQIIETMTQRNQYRDLISNRKDKEKQLQDILALDKIDINLLSKALMESKESLVREEVIRRGEKQLMWLQYCQDIVQQLQQALQEKNKENVIAFIERIDKEQISIEPKQLNDAKNALAKMK